MFYTWRPFSLTTSYQSICALQWVLRQVNQTAGVSEFAGVI
jgi:hypothetical protein